MNGPGLHAMSDTLPDTETLIELEITQNMTQLGRAQPCWETSNKFLLAGQNVALAQDEWHRNEVRLTD